MTIFGRTPPGGHPFDYALGQLLEASRPSWDRAMARNIMHDHRVTAEREAALQPFVRHAVTSRGAFITDAALESGAKTYFDERVRKADPPDFVNPRLNGPNILDGVVGDLLLARVVDLNGLAQVFEKEARAGNKVFEGFVWNDPDHPEVHSWLGRLLDRVPSAQVDDFIESVLGAMNESKPFHPTWALLWSEFLPHSGEGPGRWLEVAGIPLTDAVSHWVMVLRYTFREAVTRVRPTILDTRWSPQHFPSPPHAPPAAGGFCMDLRTSPPAEELVSEYIHPQVRHTLAQFLASGRLIGVATGDASRRLENQRRAHHRLLVREFGLGVEEWMDAPV